MDYIHMHLFICLSNILYISTYIIHYICGLLLHTEINVLLIVSHKLPKSISGLLNVISSFSINLRILI